MDDTTADPVGDGTRPPAAHPHDEQPLHGGITNAGAVSRQGDHVLRPANPWSPSVLRFLAAVGDTGFRGASRPVGDGLDPDGRERLELIPGEAPSPPYPAWAQTDEALASTAALLAGLHAAARAFDPSGWAWNDEVADPVGGPIVCHNDICLDNVVFDDGRAVGFIDFDFAAPGRPLYDLAHLVRHCVPIADDGTTALLGWQPADRPARMRIATDAYGLDADERAELLTVIDVAMRRSRDLWWNRVQRGDPMFRLLWEVTGGHERFDERDAWWAHHRAAFAAALR